MDARVNVLEIPGNAVVGGMESYVLRLVQRLPSRFNVVALCPFASPFTTQLAQAGCEVHVVSIDDDPKWEAVRAGATLVSTRGIRVIHAHLANAHALAAIIGRLTGVPVLATVHGRSVPVLDVEAQRLGDTHLSVVCRSAWLQALAVGVPARRVHFVPNGVDTTAFAPAAATGALQRALGLDARTPLVGFVGRLADEKGPDVFLRAAAVARKRAPQLHFVIVGEGNARRELEALARSLGLGDRLHFAGAQHDMPAVYRDLEIVVNTSRTEGMPLSLMEAMACARATVANHVGGVGEIVQAGVTGFLPPAGDVDAIAHDVALLARDRELRRAMGRAARERIVREFDLAASVRGMAGVLADLAQTDTGPSAARPRAGSTPRAARA